jgi:tRNA threonylcarbamoyladenosine biosynthesis protein TsaB
LLYQNLEDGTTNSPHIIFRVRILAVDTSSERGSACIAENGELLGMVGLACSIQHSERLFRSIDFLLDYVPFTLADIDLFAAARGPGSFTGLRIGLAAMEGFAAANGRPGAGVSTLEALAWRCGSTEALIAPVIDARRGEVYGALYRRAGDDLIEERAACVMSPDAWFGSLPGVRIEFCGDGAQRHRERISRPLWSLREMDLYLAGAVAQLAERARCGPLEPLYVRRTYAELARDRHHESLAGPNTKSTEA